MNAKTSLRLIRRILLKTQATALKRSNLWLVGLAFAVLLALVSAGRLKTLLSIDDLIDSDFQSYAPLTHLNREFSDKNDLLLVVTGPGRSPNRAELCSVERWIYHEVDGNPDFRRMFSVFGIAKPKFEKGRFSIPHVLSLPCETNTPEADALVRDQLRKVSESPWGKIMTSGSGNDIILSFYLNDTAKDLRFGAFDVSLVPAIEKSFETEVLTKHPELQVHWAGVAPHQYYLKAGLDQTNLLNLGIPILACFLFWLFFANARIGVLFVFMISLAAILVYGTMAAFGAPIDVLANTLVLMVMLSSLEDFLFLIHHHQEGIRPWRQGFRRLITPAFFTSFTTAVGFISLYTSNLATIRRFGVFAAYAALLEWAMVFLFLPALLERFPRLRGWLLPKFDRRKWIQSLSDQIARFRFPRLVSIALISVYAFSAFGLSKLRVSDAPANIFQKGHPVTEALDYLKRTRGWESQVSLVYQDSHRSAENRAVEAEIAKLPNVVTIESPYGIEDYLAEGLPAMETAQVRDLWKYSDASSRYIAKDGTARSLVYLRKIDTASIDALSTEVTRRCPAGECHLAGTLVAYTEFGDRVLDTLLESLGLSLILVSAVVFYLLRAKGQTVYFSTLFSIMWGPFALICIFWAFDFPITYVTCTFASIVVGIAGDNTIQYLFAARSGSLHQGIDKQARASVVVTLMMMGLSLLFYGSYFASVRSLATLFVLGFALTLIGDLWVFKGLISRRT